MNIALTTLVFLIFLLPGFIFRRIYYSGEFSKEYFKEHFVSLIFPTLISSSVIHLLGYYCLPNVITQPDIKTISALLSGTTDSNVLSSALSNMLIHLPIIFWYTVIISLLAMIFGLACKWIVRRLKLDRKFKILRFQNEWHYVFSGEILDFPGVPGESDYIDFVYVDALTETKEGTIIYRGILADYVLTAANGIDRIYLKEVKRRYLNQDNQSDSAYYLMPGDFFVIPFSQVANLHLSYYRIPD